MLVQDGFTDLIDALGFPSVVSRADDAEAYAGKLRDLVAPYRPVPSLAISCFSCGACTTWGIPVEGVVGAPGGVGRVMVDPIVGALIVIAGKATVARAVGGHDVANENWAETGREVVDAVTGAVSDAQYSLRAVSRRIDRMPLERYAEHMTAGVRFMSDLPVTWRTEEDRRDLVRDARAEFVRAAAVAHQMGDLRLQVQAELAVASCWVWVPSLPDVRRTLERAEGLLVKEVSSARVAAETLQLYDRTRALRSSFERERLAVPSALTATIPYDSRRSASIAGVAVSLSEESRAGWVEFNVTNSRRDPVVVLLKRRQGLSVERLAGLRLRAGSTKSLGATALWQSSDDRISITAEIGGSEARFPLEPKPAGDNGTRTPQRSHNVRPMR